MPCSGGSRSVGGHISGRPGLAAVAAKQRCAGRHAETGCTIRWRGSPKFRADAAVAWPPKSQSQPGMFSARMFLPWRTHMRAGPGAGSDDHRRVFRYWRGVGPGARLPITGNVTGDGDPERPVDLARSHGPCSPRSSNPGARHPHGCWLPRRKRPVRSSRPPTAPQAQPTSSRAGLLRQLSRRTGQALPVASAKAQALSSQRAALVL